MLMPNSPTTPSRSVASKQAQPSRLQAHAVSDLSSRLESTELNIQQLTVELASARHDAEVGHTLSLEGLILKV